MMNILNHIRTSWIAVTACSLSVITILSLWPLDKLPSVPGDKTQHLIAYAVLMLPAALRKPNKWYLIALLFIAYGGALELLQPYVNRYGEWLDLMANTAGVVCGIIVAELMNFFFPANLK